MQPLSVMRNTQTFTIYYPSVSCQESGMKIGIGMAIQSKVRFSWVLMLSHSHCTGMNNGLGLSFHSLFQGPNLALLSFPTKNMVISCQNKHNSLVNSPIGTDYALCHCFYQREPNPNPSRNRLSFKKDHQQTMESEIYYHQHPRQQTLKKPNKHTSFTC